MSYTTPTIPWQGNNVLISESGGCFSPEEQNYHSYEWSKQPKF